MKVYKVVRKVGTEGTLWSAIWRAQEKDGYLSTKCEAQLEYGLGKVTKPIFGSIFAFTELEMAKQWFRSYSRDTSIWEADATNVRPIKVICSDHANCEVNFREFWKMRGHRKHIAITELSAPKGTVICSTLKLVRRIS